MLQRKSNDLKHTTCFDAHPSKKYVSTSFYRQLNSSMQLIAWCILCIRTQIMVVTMVVTSSRGQICPHDKDTHKEQETEVLHGALRVQVLWHNMEPPCFYRPWEQRRGRRVLLLALRQHCPFILDNSHALPRTKNKFFKNKLCQVDLFFE